MQQSMMLVAALFGLCTPTAQTELPTKLGSNMEFDSMLPFVWKGLTSDGADMMWAGASPRGWKMQRNSLTGVVLSRSADFGAIHRVPESKGLGKDFCIYIDLQVAQEHIANGSFGKLFIVGPNNSRAGSLEIDAGDRVECTLADKLKFGYRGGM
jgi:hypothetical protein